MTWIQSARLICKQRLLKDYRLPDEVTLYVGHLARVPTQRNGSERDVKRNLVISNRAA